MKNFKQLKDGIVEMLEGNDMIETVKLVDKASKLFDSDEDMRYAAFAPSNFSVGKTDYSITLTFGLTTKVPKGDQDAYITAQEEHVLITAQIKDKLDHSDVDSVIQEAIFALPEDKGDSTVVSATFDLRVTFQRVQYRFYDE